MATTTPPHDEWNDARVVLASAVERCADAAADGAARASARRPWPEHAAELGGLPRVTASPANAWGGGGEDAAVTAEREEALFDAKSVALPMLRRACQAGAGSPRALEAYERIVQALLDGDATVHELATYATFIDLDPLVPTTRTTQEAA